MQTIDVDEIAGTAVGGGAQRGGDFLPLKPFRGGNWTGRWQRLRRAQDGLAVLPPIDVVKSGDGYWVVDGHNRVGLALYGGQAAIDADVTELVPLGERRTEPIGSLATSVAKSRAVRTAGSGHRPSDALSHEDAVSTDPPDDRRMTRSLTVVWPDPRPFAARDGAPIRLLAVSDAPDPALDHAVNRDALGTIDAVVGCGDLEPGYLGFLGDAFRVPVAFVRGNHDRGGQWAESAAEAPKPLASGHLVQLDGITVAPFEWPGLDPGTARATRRAPGWTSRERLAVWSPAACAGTTSPLLVVSHAPPRGVGDCDSDPYHVGFGAYRWLLERVRPPLWLHGHTTPASVADWRDAFGPSVVANVTGSVIVELVPPPASPVSSR